MSPLPIEEDTPLPFDDSPPPSIPSTKEVEEVGTPATEASGGSSGADDVDLERNDSVREVLFEDDEKEDTKLEVKGTFTSLPFDESLPPSTPSTKKLEVKVCTPATEASESSSGADNADLERNGSVRKVLFEDNKKEEAEPEVKGTFTSHPFDESSPSSTPSTTEVKIYTPTTEAFEGSSGADDVDLERNGSPKKGLLEDDKKEEVRAEVKGTPTKRMYILLALIFVVIAVVVPVVIVLTGKDDEADTSRSIIAPTEPSNPPQPTSPAEPATSTQPTSPAEPTTPTQPTSPAETTQPTTAPTNPPTTPVPTTSSPTSAPTTSSPTSGPTTISPTPAPTVDRLGPLVNFLAGQTGSTISEDPTSPVNLALQFLLEQDDLITFDEKLVQRFALLSLDYALSTGEHIRVQDDGSTMVDPGTTNTIETRIALSWSLPNVDECLWNGVVCEGNIVTKLLFGGRNLEGEIPSHISMLSGLRHLDMANNKLSGPLPEELYNLAMLEAIYLYKNELSGSLTNSIARLGNLTHLCLNDNSFTGNLPTAWKSTTLIRPLHWLNLYNNGFTGPIPSDLRWRHMFYFDVGYNQLTGQLPDDLGDDFARLRHLHLDHNQFSGTLPTSYIRVGGGRLESLTVDHNQLGGAVPSNFVFTHKLVYYTLDNNNFSSRLDNNICKLSVFGGGENIDFRADCDICSCGGIMCTNCVNNSG